MSENDSEPTWDIGRVDESRLVMMTGGTRILRQTTKLRLHGHNVWEMTDEERIEFIRWNVLAATDELHEALQECGWKPWGSSRHLNRDAYLEELADVQLFLDNLVLMAIRDDQDGDDLGDEFDTICYRKIVNSERRQRDGYNGFTEKCPNCRRDLKIDQVCQCSTT